MENKHGIEPWLWQFALETISQHNMDSSHGMGHFVNTFLWAGIILRDFVDVDIIEGLSHTRTHKLILDAAFSHDLIDSKYMNETAAVTRLRERFTINGYHPDLLDMLVEIITSIGFSKRHARVKKGLPMIMPGRLATAIAIVADADQLDAMNPERCKVYQENKHLGDKYSHMTRGEKELSILRWRATILRKRVLLYKDQYMSTSIGRLLAEPLHNHVVDHVERELSGVEPFDY